jgi:hypothetical protein
MVFSSIFINLLRRLKKYIHLIVMAGFSAAGHLAAVMDVYEWTISYFLARKEVSTIRWTATSVGHSFHIAFLVARYTGQGGR